MWPVAQLRVVCLDGSSTGSRVVKDLKPSVKSPIPGFFRLGDGHVY
jgi:hypothetical protein